MIQVGQEVIVVMLYYLVHVLLKVGKQKSLCEVKLNKSPRPGGLPKWCSWQRTLLLMQETQETQIQSLGQEDPLEEGMATHSNILAWRTPWTEEPGGL